MTADGIGAASMAALSLRAAVATGDADRIEAAWHATGPAERTDPALLRELADAAERCGRAALLDEALQAATALAPDDLWLHVRYVRAARERPDPRLALARTDRFLAFHPEAGLIHVMRGEALLDLDEAAEAEESFREAVRIEPTLVWSHVRYAGSARARGDAEAWLHRLQAGFLVLPDDPLIARELADALSESGRTREARRLLADALAANPGDAELRQRLDRPAAPPSGRYSGAIGVLVSRDPAIICSAVYSFEPVVDAVMPLYQARGQPVTFLFESLQSIVFHEVLRARFPRQVAGLQARHPLARIRFLVNDLHELEVARAVGLDSEIINNNAFVDEDVYRILPDTPKRYDAVYNARLHPYKRHELATRLERLLLLVADPEPEQLARCRALLPHATVNRDHLAAAEVVRQLNSARCGLCLSATEGAMYASIEYLLCGLPVATTRSVGGRDWFFSDDYVAYCDDDPDAVRHAVASALARRVGADFIRENTLARMYRERLAFFDVIERVFAQAGQPGRRAAPEFRSWFSDKANYVMRPLAAFAPD